MNKILVSAVFFLAFSSVRAQEKPAAVPSPDAPASVTPPPAGGVPGSSEQTSSSAPANRPGEKPEPEPRQTRRILGIVPNFRSVSADVALPPQSAKDKFRTGFRDSFDYSAFLSAGIQAGISQASNATPAFRQGAAGYGRYYWHTFADRTDENLWVLSILPSVLHQDNRYYTLQHGGFFKRTRYALTRTIVTRTDGGRETFNASEIIGTGAAAGISSAYYPGQYRTWTKTGQRWISYIITDSATWVAREFWPDIHRALFHGRD